MIKIDENVSLKDKTSFKIGGVASYFAVVGSKEDLVEAHKFAKENGWPIFVLGDGTDILLSDRKFESLVIKFVNQDYSSTQLEGSKFVVNAGAGLNWDELVAKTVKEGLQGIECLSGIPGTVGASPVQNIGAYGQEIKDTLISVEALDTNTGEFVSLKNLDCLFEYRESIFKKQKGRYLVYEVTLQLKKDGPPTLKYASLLEYLDKNGNKNPSLAEIRQAVLKIRSQKLESPDKVGNAGSFFKNPLVNMEQFEKLKSEFADIPHFGAQDKVKIPAGWLVDRAGWKGKNFGEAGVSDKNALVLINKTGNAKAEEVRGLAETIIKDVKDKFGVELEPEVQFINF